MMTVRRMGKGALMKRLVRLATADADGVPHPEVRLNVIVVLGGAPIQRLAKTAVMACPQKRLAPPPVLRPLSPGWQWLPG